MGSMRARGFVAILAVTIGACGAAGSAGPGDAPLVPESQRSALADGVVAFAEFESAIFSTKACLEEDGFRIGDFDVHESGWSMSYSSPFDSGTEDARYAECYDEYLSHVEPAYLGSVDDSTGEADDQVQRIAHMVDCLAELGLDLPGDASWREIQEAGSLDPPGWVRCMNQWRAEP